jgi:iron complex transport system substrate-binding protein
VRIVCLLPGVTETVYGLGLGDGLVARAAECIWPPPAIALPVAARYVAPGERPDFAPLIKNTPPHEHTSRLLIDLDALGAADPDLILAEETCPVCRAAYAPVAGASAGVFGTSISLAGRTRQVISATPQHLQDAVDVILPLSEILGVAERGNALHKQRDARLLALRMHIARYLVRVGGTQPRVVAVVQRRSLGRKHDRDAASEPAPWIADMLDAGGGVGVAVLDWTNPPALPSAEITAAAPELLLLGRAGESPQFVRDSLGPLSNDTSPLACRAWALDADDIFSFPGPHLVEGVECLIRIVIPEALGANGTPPSPQQALPIGVC